MILFSRTVSLMHFLFTNPVLPLMAILMGFPAAAVASEAFILPVKIAYNRSCVYQLPARDPLIEKDSLLVIKILPLHRAKICADSSVMAAAVAAAARSAVTFPSLAEPSFPGIRTCVHRISVTDCCDYLRQEITHVDGSAVYIMKPVIRGVFFFTMPAPYPGGMPSFLHNRGPDRLSLEKLSGDQEITPSAGIGIAIRFSKKDEIENQFLLVSKYSFFTVRSANKGPCFAVAA